MSPYILGEIHSLVKILIATGCVYYSKMGSLTRYLSSAPQMRLISSFFSMLLKRLFFDDGEFER
jgi:hypothetical protein